MVPPAVCRVADVGSELRAVTKNGEMQRGNGAQGCSATNDRTVEHDAELDGVDQVAPCPMLCIGRGPACEPSLPSTMPSKESISERPNNVYLYIYT